MLDAALPLALALAELAGTNSGANAACAFVNGELGATEAAGAGGGGGGGTPDEDALGAGAGGAGGGGGTEDALAAEAELAEDSTGETGAAGGAA